MVEIASFASFFDEHIVDTHKLPAFVYLLFFLGTFAFIRTSAHMIRAQVSWWPGNVEVGGTHIHHLVWGILLLMIAGWVGIVVAPEPPGREIVAAVFGIGIGLTLDEFALWLELKDVYWSADGRKSIDAVIVAGIIASFGVLGFTIWVDAADDVAVVVHALIGFFGRRQPRIRLDQLREGEVRHRPARARRPVPVVDRRAATRPADVTVGAASLSQREEAVPGAEAVRRPEHVRASARAVDAARQGVAREDAGSWKTLNTTAIDAATGIASSAPRMPASWAPAKTTRIAISGFTLTARP